MGECIAGTKGNRIRLCSSVLESLLGNILPVVVAENAIPQCNSPLMDCLSNDSLLRGVEYSLESYILFSRLRPAPVPLLSACACYSNLLLRFPSIKLFSKFDTLKVDDDCLASLTAAFTIQDRRYQRKCCI